MECDYCAYNAYDEDEEEYYCSVNLDEDDMARFMSHKYKKCPYFKNGDEISCRKTPDVEKDQENVIAGSTSFDLCKTGSRPVSADRGHDRIYCQKESQVK